MPKEMRSWGDLNIFLNGLVREGVISGFATNRTGKSNTADVRILVAPEEDVSSALDRVKQGLSGVFAQLPVAVAPLDRSSVAAG